MPPLIRPDPAMPARSFRLASAGSTRRQMGGLLAALGILGGMPERAFGEGIRSKWDPFLIYYGHQGNPAIAGYNLMVLDPDAAPTILARHASTATCLGYLSVAEVHSDRG